MQQASDVLVYNPVTSAMANISKLQTLQSLTSDFKSIFFPLYSTSEILNSHPKPTTDVPRIGQLALNIFSPTIKIPQYEKLLCQEMGGRQNDYDTHQSVKSIWFSGHPLSQLSPEAITELCFRFSNYFPHNNVLNTVRGMSARWSELNREIMALLSGLKFNCLEVYVDASVASNDRSLDKVGARVALIADYEGIKLNFKVKFSDNTHPEFLMRLLALLENVDCQQIELVCEKSQRFVTLSHSNRDESKLLEINRYFAQLGWLGCGNNVFYSPQHENNELYKHRKLLLTPWGYHDQAIQTRLGVGLGALSFIDNKYELSTVSTERYEQSVNGQRAVPATHFVLDPLNKPLIQLAQNLVCYRQIETAVSSKIHANNHECSDLLSQLVNQGSMEPAGDILKLTDKGLVNLIAISKFLFSRVNVEDYNHGKIQQH